MRLIIKTVTTVVYDFSGIAQIKELPENVQAAVGEQMAVAHEAGFRVGMAKDMQVMATVLKQQFGTPDMQLSASMDFSHEVKL